MGSEEREEAVRPASETLRVADRRASIVPMIAIAVVASVLGIVLGLLIDWFPVQASTQAQDIDTFYDVLIAASVPVFVLVTSVVLYCVWRFRMRPGEEQMDGPPVHGNTRLEVIWTVIPAVMMLALCTYAFVVLENAEEAPAATAAEELDVRVVGEQFTWTFYYPGEGAGEDGEIASSQLYLPIDRSVRFTVQTKDVLHDFWVPAFRWKVDAVPGQNTHYRVTPNRIGRYEIVCAELCGLGHAVMRQSARVVQPQAFETWLTQQRQRGEQSDAQGGGAINAGSGGTTTSPAASAEEGKALFAANGCGGCHVLADANAAGQTGPNLDESLADDDDAYILESIVEPDAEIAEGYSPGVMPPNYGETMTPAEIDALVSYLKEATKG
jgi:cytochrome c oxidase subunit 2